MSPCGPSWSRSWPRSRSRPATSGARTGRSRPSTAPPRWRGCWSTPTPTRSGCPTRGCRSSTRSSTSGADAVAERAYAPWTDLEAAAPGRGPAAVLGRHPPAGRRLRRPGLQPLGRARLHERPQLHRPGRRARAGRGPRAPSDPLVGAGGHCTYNPEPLADFVDFFVLGDGEEVVGEITEVIGALEGAPARRDRCRTCLRELASVTGVYVPDALRGRLRRRRLVASVTPRRPGVPEHGREAHHRRPGRVAVPQAPAGAADRGRARPAQRRGLPGLHPRAAASARPA